MASIDGRRITAHGLVVLVCVLVPLAMVSSWISAVVTDTGRYVDTVAPLASDSVVKKAVEKDLTRLALDAIDLPKQRQALVAYLSKRLAGKTTAGSEAAARLLENGVRNVVGHAVVTVVESEQFADAWRKANQSAHEQLVAVLGNDDTSALDSKGRVNIRLATLLNSVLDIVGASLPVKVNDVPDAGATFAILKASDLRKARLGYRVLDAVGFWLPVGTLLLLAVAVLVSTDRRQTLGIFGYGTIIALALLSIALAIARHLVLGAVPDTNHDLLAALWAHLFADLRTSIRLGVVVAIAVLVGRWLAGTSASATGVRAGAGQAATALVRERTTTVRVLLAVAGAVVVMLVLR